jgi:hypothetical protein
LTPPVLPHAHQVVEAASNGAEVEASSNGNGAAETVAPASLDLAWQEPSNSDK